MKLNPPEFPIWLETHKYADEWCDFHTTNPGIYVAIVRHLHECSQENRRTSIKEVVNRLRFDKSVKINGSYTYQINDAFTSIYGAVIYHNIPGLRHVFTSKLYHELKQQSHEAAATH
jgi:hypothetical protein